jgi:hypothetical protein
MRCAGHLKFNHRRVIGCNPTRDRQRFIFENEVLLMIDGVGFDRRQPGKPTVRLHDKNEAAA